MERTLPSFNLLAGTALPIDPRAVLEPGLNATPPAETRTLSALSTLLGHVFCSRIGSSYVLYVPRPLAFPVTALRPCVWVTEPEPRAQWDHIHMWPVLPYPRFDFFFFFGPAEP
jgi:hypothetical protein